MGGREEKKEKKREREKERKEGKEGVATDFQNIKKNEDKKKCPRHPNQLTQGLNEYAVCQSQLRAVHSFKSGPLSLVQVQDHGQGQNTTGVRCDRVERVV